MNKLEKIKDVSTQYQVATSTLRYYEKMGLIKSSRCESSGYRLYDEMALTCLRQVLILRKMNISIGDIKEIFEANNSDSVLSVLDRKLDDIDSEVAMLHELKEIVLEFINQIRKIDFHNDAEVKLLFERASVIEISLVSADMGRLFDTSDVVGDGVTSVVVEEKVDTISKVGYDNFEIKKCGPYRFIGKSVYTRAFDKKGSPEILRSFRKQCNWVFETLDTMKEFASDEVNNSAIQHWELFRQPHETMTHWPGQLLFGGGELYGYTIGRFMKADTPVPDDMDYIDIAEMYIAKGWNAVVPCDDIGEPDEGPMLEEIEKTEFQAASWLFAADIFPFVASNGTLTRGTYMACSKKKSE